MEKTKAVAKFQEAARKDTLEAENLLGWLSMSIHAIEHGLQDKGESLGAYNDELRYMRTYIERLTRLSIQSYGCEEAIKALNEIDD